jgi:type III pantothenate kinase
MLLAINIGNTNITFGGFDHDGKLAFSAKLYADPAASADELTYKFINMLALYGVSPLDIRACILASVVPALTGRVKEALGKMCAARPMVVGPGLKSGLPLRMETPSQLGAELLCAAVAALKLYHPPLIVMNMDTATTMLALDVHGALTGAAILPGPQLSLAALVRNTAQLPQVELDAAPRALLGTNTADSLHSGIVNGTACMLDGMVHKFRAALSAPDAPVVATGILPQSVRRACTCGIDYRDSLVLQGLYLIWQRNAK